MSPLASLPFVVDGLWSSQSDAAPDPAGIRCMNVVDGFLLRFMKLRSVLAWWFSAMYEQLTLSISALKINGNGSGLCIVILDNDQSMLSFLSLSIPAFHT